MTESSAELALLLATVGAVLLLAPATQVLADRLRLPRVTLLLLLGVLLGPLALDVLPQARARWYPALANVALAMVGFLLGGEFTLSSLRRRGRAVLGLSLGVALVSAALVTGGLVALGVSLPVALVLGAAATATDPAAVDAVTRDCDTCAENASLLRGVVAIDDVWGLLIFGGAMALLGNLAGEAEGSAALLYAGRELGGSVLLGVLLGAPMALLTGRLNPGEPTRLEALGFVLLCSGLASLLELSYLLSAVAMGATVANLARHHERPFHELEDIEVPFLVLFFVLSGSTAELDALRAAGGLALAYVLLRVGGRVLGGWLGAVAGGRLVRRDLGLALLPQAGVALGMTLVAVERFPDLGEELLPVVMLATVLFEAAGPVLTRRTLARAGELPGG